MSAAERRLRCFSFHSVKGGVGKSTLATAMAAELAHRGLRTALVDFDLTGTSLADVLPLEPPDFATDAAGVLDFSVDPPGYLSWQEGRDRMERRAFEGAKDLEAAAADIPPRHVPLLNDYLLYSDATRDREVELPPARFGWRWGPVAAFPSSALPADVARIMPMVYDEEFGSFFEARLEWFLDGLCAAGFEAAVFDSPPTVPGLSRSLLSLGLRLGNGGAKIPLATDGFVPPSLAQRDLLWRAFMVVSSDPQDVSAAVRWLDLSASGDDRVLRLLANRMGRSDLHAVQEQYRRAFASQYARIYVERAVVVPTDERMGLKHWQDPPTNTALTTSLREQGVLEELGL